MVNAADAGGSRRPSHEARAQRGSRGDQARFGRARRRWEHEELFLGIFFWQQTDFTADGFDEAARDEVLEALGTCWASSVAHASIRLGV